MKIGLKLWSTNTNVITEALAICKKGLCDYIELFYVPGSINLISYWKKMAEIPFVIHAPHTEKGLNPADSSMHANNVKLAEESFTYAQKLNADFVIFHPGMGGSLEEVVRQLKTFGATKKMLIENKPYRSINEPVVFCRGFSPQEIKYIVMNGGLGFCLDIGHAICAANSLKLDALAFIAEFAALQPTLYHISDGDFGSPIDSHLNFGQGNYPLKKIADKIPGNSMLTIETNKNLQDDLSDFVQDVLYLRNLPMQQSRNR